MIEKFLKLPDEEIGQLIFVDNSVFSLALLRNLAQQQDAATESIPARPECISVRIDQYIRMTVINANAAQSPYELSRTQVSQLQTLVLDDTLSPKIARKMHNNSQKTHIDKPGFESMKSIRPTSAFYFLIRDADHNELLIVLEGLVNQEGVAKVHNDLRRHEICSLLTEQIKKSGGTQVIRSGHTWGNIAFLDCDISPPLNLDPEKLAKSWSEDPMHRWVQKLETVFLKAGWLVIGPMGEIAQLELLKAKMTNSSSRI